MRRFKDINHGFECRSRMYEPVSNFDEEFFDLTLFRIRVTVIDKSNDKTEESQFEQKIKSYLENNYFHQEEKISEKGCALLDRIKSVPPAQMIETENSNIKKTLIEMCCLY